MKKKIRDAERFMRASTPARQERDHVTRVVGYAGRIANKSRKCDKDILYAAALLHDIGRIQAADRHRKDLREKGHAALGAAVAYEYLLQQGWGQKKAAHVCACIKSHSRNGSHPPASLEAKILYDADKLDILGAVGAARIIAYAGEETPLWEPQGKNDGADSAKEKRSIAAECREIVATTGNSLYTEEGRRLAKAKIETMKRYSKDIEKEAKLADKYAKKYPGK